MKSNAEKHDNWKYKPLIAPFVVGAVVGSLLALAIAPTGAPNLGYAAAELVGSSEVGLADSARELRDNSVASRSTTQRGTTSDAEVTAEVPTDPAPDPGLPATSVSAAGLEKLKEFEGFSLRGYLLGDGKCTIGWGHAVPVAQRPNCSSWVITEEEARAKFASDVSRFEDAVNAFFTRDFNQNQFDAIVSFAYNVGQVWFRWDWPTDPDDDFFQWVLPLYIYPAQFREGLMRRRAAELELFNTPVA